MWFHGHTHTSKPSKIYTLNIYSFLYVSYNNTSINVLKSECIGITITNSYRDLTFKIISLITGLGDNSWVFCISAYLKSRGPGYFCSRLSFQWCLYSKQPGKVEMCLPVKHRAGLFTVWYEKDNVSLWGKGQSCLPVHYKRSEFPMLGASLCNATHGIYLLDTTLRDWSLGHGANVDTLATVFLWVINWPLSLTQESYVLCQPLWNYGCLTC